MKRIGPYINTSIPSLTNKLSSDGLLLQTIKTSSLEKWPGCHPAASLVLALLIWPLVIFIILAVTRSQFPPKLKDTCYVAPRNLPSTGFFPFLQTLMCSTDSSCATSSYLTEGQSRSYLYRNHRHRRDVESHSLPTLLHGLPTLADLPKGGLVHAILKRDTSHPELQQLWDRMLNSSLPNATSVLAAFNNTLLVDQSMESVWESVNILKKSLCSFSMTGMNISAGTLDPYTQGLINFCSSNDTVLESSLFTMNQVLTQWLLSNTTEVVEVVGGTVMVMDRLQQESSVWDFLLGLRDVFLKPTDEEVLQAGVGELENLKTALTFLQASFPQANISTSLPQPVINNAIDILTYLAAWKGRDTYVKLTDVMSPSSIVLLSSDMKDLISQIQIPLDKVLVVWSQSSATADMGFSKQVFSSLLGLISPSSLDSVLKHSRSQRSSDAQPQSLGEQLIFGLGSTALDFLQGMPGWEYIQTFMMGGFSSMQVARVAMEAQLPIIDVVLKDAKYVQEVFLFLMRNETFANAWTEYAMDSVVQTVSMILQGNTSCADLSAPWAWMSKYSSIDIQLWSTLLCSGSDTKLEQILLTALLPVIEKGQQLVDVLNGTVMYNVTPSTLMAEWHSLYTTYIQYANSAQKLQTDLNEEYFATWIPGNISASLFQILSTRSETYLLFNKCSITRGLHVKNYIKH